MVNAVHNKDELIQFYKVSAVHNKDVALIQSGVKSLLEIFKSNKLLGRILELDGSTISKYKVGKTPCLPVYYKMHTAFPEYFPDFPKLLASKEVNFDWEVTVDTKLLLLCVYYMTEQTSSNLGKIFNLSGAEFKTYIQDFSKDVLATEGCGLSDKVITLFLDSFENTEHVSMFSRLFGKELACFIIGNDLVSSSINAELLKKYPNFIRELIENKFMHGKELLPPVEDNKSISEVLIEEAEIIRAGLTADESCEVKAGFKLEAGVPVYLKKDEDTGEFTAEKSPEISQKIEVALESESSKTESDMLPKENIAPLEVKGLVDFVDFISNILTQINKVYSDLNEFKNDTVKLNNKFYSEIDGVMEITQNKFENINKDLSALNAYIQNLSSQIEIRVFEAISTPLKYNLNNIEVRLNILEQQSSVKSYPISKHSIKLYLEDHIKKNQSYYDSNYGDSCIKPKSVLESDLMRIFFKKLSPKIGNTDVVFEAGKKCLYGIDWLEKSEYLPIACEFAKELFSLDPYGVFNSEIGE